jgi:hypothetical protein
MQCYEYSQREDNGTVVSVQLNDAQTGLKRGRILLR